MGNKKGNKGKKNIDNKKNIVEEKIEQKELEQSQNNLENVDNISKELNKENENVQLKESNNFTLSEQEEDIVEQKKFGFNRFDSSISLIIGGICVPFAFSIIALIVLSLVSVISGVGADKLLEIPIVYTLVSCSALIGYGLFALYMCKKKNKDKKNILKLQDVDVKTRTIIFKKVNWKMVLICVVLPLIALFLTSYFVNLVTAGLQNIGYSKPNDLPFKIDNFWNFLLSLIFLSSLPAFVEELLFRGIILGGLLNSAKTHKARVISVFVSALLFALCHQSALQFVYPLIMGVVFGFIYMYTGNIWYSIIAHFTSNAVVCLVNFISELSGNVSTSIDVTWLYAVIAILTLAVFITILYFVLKLIRKMCKNSSSFDLDNTNVNQQNIEKCLVESKEDLMYTHIDGVYNYRKSMEEKDKLAIIYGAITIAILLGLLINDLITYIK